MASSSRKAQAGAPSAAPAPGDHAGAERAALWRSTASLPLRPSEPWADGPSTVSGRIPQFAPRPNAGDGYTPKAFSGEAVPFRVVSFREGHDRIGVQLRLCSPSGDESLHRLSPLGDGFDTWEVWLTPIEEGVWKFRFETFADEYASWAHAAEIKLAAGIDSAVMREQGALLFERAVIERDRPKAERQLLSGSAAALRDVALGDADALSIVRDERLAAAFAARPLRSLLTLGDEQELRVERTRAGVGSWYEFFPRSEGAKRRKDGTIVSGTFRTAAKRLPAIAAMGFDVLYLPPIHPIGERNRKGPNNSLTTGPGDPGSPWAIGSASGGHDTVHPDLGTLADFRWFVREAAAHGIEIALDLALQAAPDHPWVESHPEWFTTLPDGSIAYAENPPKKYQDIYPINFDGDPAGFRTEALRIVRHWIAQGVRIFRVDNPHTKPLQFWERLIATVNAEYPDVVFLAEAFSRPNVMLGLAKAGFQQSYSYFTWRNTKAELSEFFDEIAHATADVFRPNLFVNTPDILTEYLQFGGRAGAAIRAILAATAGASWGVYAGFELFEQVARPGSEENIDNEKYEYKLRNWADAEARGESLAPLLTSLNRLRREHPALRQLRNLHLHWSDDDAVLVYSKHLPAALTATGESDTIIVVVNVDPHSARETTVHLDQRAWGGTPGRRYTVEDLLSGASWQWGDHAYVRLDPFVQAAHVLRVRSTA